MDDLADTFSLVSYSVVITATVGQSFDHSFVYFSPRSFCERGGSGETTKGASPNHFAEDNVIVTLRGGGGQGRDVNIS